MTYSVPALLWSVSPSLQKWSLMTDNLDPIPVGLPTTMSTSNPSYHVHLDSDSDHAAQY